MNEGLNVGLWSNRNVKIEFSYFKEKDLLHVVMARL